MTAPVDHVDQIMSVMHAAFSPEYGEAWSRRQVEDSLLTGHCNYSLVDELGRIPSCATAIAGFSLSRVGFEEEELLLLAVSPLFRRRGIGATLLNEFIKSARLRGAKRLLLEMRDGNPAESLYRSAGFHVIGQRPQYYRSVSGARLGAITFAKDF